MAMSVVAFGLFQPWLYGFLTTLFMHGEWFGLGYTLLVIHAFLWPSDHAQDTPEMLFPFQVWLSWIYLPGAWVAVAFVHTFGSPKLVDPHLLEQQSPRSRFTLTGAATHAFVMGWLALFAAINFFFKRYSKTGMSPFDPSLSDAESNAAGGITLAVAVILLAWSNWAMGWNADPEQGRASRRNLKYFWVLAGVMWIGFVHDYITDVVYAGAVAWLPGGVTLAVFAVLMLVVAPLVAARVSAHTDLDPFYGHQRRAFRFFFAAFLVAALALVIAWILNNVTDANEIVIFSALVGYSVGIVVVMDLAASRMKGPGGEPYNLLGTRFGQQQKRRRKAKATDVDTQADEPAMLDFA
jgi:hypothetical protein